MSLLLILSLAAAALGLGYVFYGRFLARFLSLDDTRATPACAVNDGEDFVPAPKGYLLGQHFSAIAAAGPIVGPILAGLWFGWGPALVWIVLGAIFIGGVHDFSALVASIRHRAKSIAEVVRLHMSRRAYLLFLAFIWLCLVYVILAFTDVTASTFVGGEEGAGVASASMLYLLLAVLMGVVVRKTGLAEGRATLIFLPLVFGAIWLGDAYPLHLPDLGIRPVLVWDYLLLLYCLVAAMTPVWALLQPRGALGGYFLYAALLAGALGLLFGGFDVQYPAWIPATDARPLFPLLFVTVACGACSGFHSIVSSGTTSKQLRRESDAKAVGYGGMLLEGGVALLALATVMILLPGSEASKQPPNRVYAGGLASFMGVFGIPADKAVAFGLLAFATFVYDTLDVCTRLGRYIFQELTGLKGRLGGVLATLATLALPAVCVALVVHDANGNPIPVWRLFWTLFGASNQLLAAMTLLGLSVWLRALGKPVWVTAIPMAFMMAMTLWALSLLAAPLWGWLQGAPLGNPVEAVLSAVLMGLALLLLAEAVQILGGKGPKPEAVTA
jgi:carbon starvation protein